MPKQLHIFIDNKPGKLKSIAKILSNSNINIKAITIQDREEYGLIKMFVDQSEQANSLLQDAGFASAIKEVLAVKIEDKPGGLYRLTEAFERHKINIIDAYSFTIQSNKSAVWCCEVDNISNVSQVLSKDGFCILDETDFNE